MASTMSFTEKLLAKKRKELAGMDKEQGKGKEKGNGKGAAPDVRALIDSKRAAAAALKTTVGSNHSPKRRRVDTEEKTTLVIDSRSETKEESKPKKKRAITLIKGPKYDEDELKDMDRERDTKPWPSCNDDVIDVGHNLTLQLDALLRITIFAPNGAFLSKVTTWDVASSLEKISRKLGVSRLDLKVEAINGETGATTFIATPEAKCSTEKIVDAIDGQQFKLPGRAYMIHVRTSIGKDRSSSASAPRPWKTNFKAPFDACLPGERADTVIITRVPLRWIPDEKVAESVFGVFGKIRQVMFVESSGGDLHSKIYVQYANYAAFERAMLCLDSRTLSFRLPGKSVRDVQFKVHFDKTGYLSEAKIRHRRWEVENNRLERERAAQQAKEDEERRIQAEIEAKKAEEERKREEERQEELKAKQLYDEWNERKRLKEEKKQLKKEKKLQKEREIEAELERIAAKEVEKAEKKEQKRLARLIKAQKDIFDHAQESKIQAAKEAAEKLVEKKKLAPSTSTAIPPPPPPQGDPLQTTTTTTAPNLLLPIPPTHAHPLGQKPGILPLPAVAPTTVGANDGTSSGVVVKGFRINKGVGLVPDLIGDDASQAVVGAFDVETGKKSRWDRNRDLGKQKQDDVNNNTTTTTMCDTPQSNVETQMRARLAAKVKEINERSMRERMMERQAVKVATVDKV